jgi:hypothetical protein
VRHGFRNGRDVCPPASYRHMPPPQSSEFSQSPTTTVGTAYHHTRGKRDGSPSLYASSSSIRLLYPAKTTTSCECLDATSCERICVCHGKSASRAFRSCPPHAAIPNHLSAPVLHLGQQRVQDLGRWRGMRGPVLGLGSPSAVAGAVSDPFTRQAAHPSPFR